MKNIAYEVVRVNATEVLVEGRGELILMVHGWPDTRELWQLQVDALAPHMRCARFTWPGFEAAPGNGPRSLDELVGLMAAVADRLSPDAPVVLLMHDWGCMFGQEFAARHPDRVSRIVAMDIGDYNAGAYLASLSLKAKLGLVSYQWWLTAAWVVGNLGLHSAANAMTRALASLMRAPGKAVHWGMNYPYAMVWLGLRGGLKHAAKVREPSHPTLYFYGLRKPFQFQSERWIAAVNEQAHAAQPACHALRTGHWLMLQAPTEVNATLLAWLGVTKQPTHIPLALAP